MVRTVYFRFCSGGPCISRLDPKLVIKTFSVPITSGHLALLPLWQPAEFQCPPPALNLLVLFPFFLFLFFFFNKARRYGIRAVTSIICERWGGGFRGLSQIYSRSWLHIMMRSLPQRCRKKLQLPLATSFFISKYGSVFDNRASAPLSGSTLAYNRSFRGLPLPSNQSLCKHANKAHSLSFWK